MKNEMIIKKVEKVNEDIIRFGELLDRYTPDYLNETIRDVDGYLRKRGDILKERLNQ